MPFVMVMHVMVTCALKPVESKVEGCGQERWMESYSDMVWSMS